MGKFLINFGSILVCLALLAVGIFLSLQQSNIGGMVDEIVAISKLTPIIPDTPSQDEGGESLAPGGAEEDNFGPDYDHTPDEGGDVVVPDPNPEPTPDPDEGGDVVVPNPDEGGDVVVPDPNPEPAPEPDKPVEPSAPTLSTEETKDAYKELYDNNDPEFSDIKKELLVNMIQGAFNSGSGGGSNSGSSGGGSTTPDVGDEEPDLDLDSGFDAEFNPDEFEPEDEPEEDSAANEINEIIASVGGTYFDNLQKEIQANQEANAGGTDDEKAAARDEFVEKEAEAFAGLINVVTKPEETTEDDLLKSVDALLNSPVCKNTVSQSVENNPTFTETVQQATENLNEDIKSEIQQKLEASLETDPESAKDYQNIADLFGITLGSGITPEIPEGFNPDDYLG